MRQFAASFLYSGLVLAAPALFNSSTDPAWTRWEAVRGSAQADPAVRRHRPASMRLEPKPGGDVYAKSSPIPLSIGAQYELSAWVKTAAVEVRDVDRSPIAAGAALSMASMPFDVHSESLGGTHDWTRLTLRFTATRTEDRIALSVANGGAGSGKAWFEAVSIDRISNTSSAGDWPARPAIQTFGPAYRYPQGGWIYLHIEGAPYERGYQHGYLLSKEIESYLERCAAQLDSKSREQAWANGRTIANALLMIGLEELFILEFYWLAYVVY